MIDLPPPSHEQTIEAIVHCDISRANISIKHEEYLQSDEVTIGDLGELTDAKLRCLKSAVHPFYILTIKNGNQQVAFYEFLEREDRPQRKARAIEWVRSKSLLAHVPNLESKESIATFASALERACGFKAGNALMIYGGSAITIRPEFLQGNSFQKSAEAIQCLTQMFEASNADEHDVRFVFIGNEAVGESTEE